VSDERDRERPGAEPEVHDEELVPADDRVIGVAFRRSALVLAALALVVLAGWGLRSLLRERQAERAIPATQPREVRRAVEAPALPFADVAAAAGIAFVHQNGAYGDKLLPETMGGGVAVLDFDGDGRLDLLFVNASPWPHRPRTSAAPALVLYRNLGGWRFEDVTARAGLDVRHYGMGVAVGDVNGNGLPDLLLTGVGGNRLFENVDGRFRDVTRRAGVGGRAEDWSTCATFFDYDNDGRLDLFVCNYVQWSKEIDFAVDYRLTGVGRAYGPPMNYEGTYPYLFRNRGDGTFEDVSASAGVQVRNPATGRPMAKALGVLPTDVDGDGYVDLFVANDTVANFFLRNRGDGTFVDEALPMGLAFGPTGVATGAMGIDGGHYRNDPEIGFFIGNFAHEMTSLYRSQGEPALYADEAIAEGIGGPTRMALSFGVALADLDLDGRLDLVQANGHLEDEIAAVDPGQSYRQSAQVFWNAGRDAERTFVAVPGAALGDLTRPIVGRSVTYGDLDGDGDLDLVLTQIAGAPLVLRNDQAHGHRWLRVEPVWGAAPSVAHGTRLEVAAGGARQRRELFTSRSYLAQIEPVATWGLGTGSAVEALRLRWPDGRVQRIVAPPAGRQLRVVRPRSPR
jgi:enediyne biosynthesis protein E4